MACGRQSKAFERSIRTDAIYDFDLLISTLEFNSNHLIEWFKINKMQANPDKFQVLAVGKKTYGKRPTINIQNHNYTENCL
jgi:hypothetical protein